MSDYQMGKELHDYLNRDFTKEVNSWLKIANKLADDRKKKEFNLTLNKSPLQKFSKDKPNQMQKLFNRKIYKAKLDYGFTIAFKGFCLEITARCKYLSENKQSIIN